MIEDLMELSTLKMPPDLARDVKKLTKFLGDLTASYNKMVKGVKKFNKVMATELVARPTYAEEF